MKIRGKSPAWKSSLFALAYTALNFNEDKENFIDTV